MMPAAAVKFAVLNWNGGAAQRESKFRECD